MAVSNLAFHLSDSISDLTVEGSFIADNYRQNSTITLITEASSQLLERDEAAASPAYGTLVDGEGVQRGRESADRRISTTVAVIPETAAVCVELDNELPSTAVATGDQLKTAVHSQLSRKLSESVSQTPSDGTEKGEKLPPVDNPPAPLFQPSPPPLPLPPLPSSDVNDEGAVRLHFDVTAVIATSFASEGGQVTSPSSDNGVPGSRSGEGQGYDNVAFSRPSPISPIKTHKIERSFSNKVSTLTNINQSLPYP
jgi:hypothetical protein